MTARFGPRFYAWLVAIGLATYLAHEGAHWLMGEALGYPMRYGLNRVAATVPTTARDAALISAAGPVLTIMQGVVAFLVVRRRGSATAFAVLLWAAFMRAVASGISLFMPNDEARVSEALGLGTWTLPLLVTGVLVVLAWIAARRMRVGWRSGLICYVVLSIVSAAIVGGDMVLGG